MSTEVPRQPVPDLDAEQEVDFGRYWRMIAARWWLPVGLLVAGLVIGYLVSLGTNSTTYKATAQVYLGQPLAPAGAAPVSSAPTSLGLVSNLVTSEATVRSVAAASGLKPGRLRGHITTKPILGITAARVGTPAPLLAITVTGSPPRKVADAANRLGAVVIRAVSGYTDLKIEKLKEQIDFDDKSIARNNDRFSIAQRQQTAILADRSLARHRAPAAAREHQHDARHRRAAPRPARVRPPRRAAVPLARRERRARPGHRAGGGDEDRRAEQPDGRGGRRADRTDRRHPRRAPLGSGRGSLTVSRRGVAVLEGKRVAVVVPAYHEETLLGQTLEGIPDFVDRIYVVDDASRDATAERAREVADRDPRVEVVVHERNQGVGGAIVTGYKRALAERIDVTCVMAADNQMDPSELASLVEPVAAGEVDYAKANRLFTGQAWQLIPRHRYLGNAVLSLLTKIASGYWHVADSQSGYTALGLATLERLDLDRIYRRYGFPNDMLVHLNVVNARVRDVPSRPVYGVGERSGIRLRKVIPRISWLLVNGFFWRLREKYVIRDFHPLVFFYFFGLLMAVGGFGLGIALIVLRALGDRITAGTGILVALLLIFGSQFTLFAMWFDMESNKDLK